MPISAIRAAAAIAWRRGRARRGGSSAPRACGPDASARGLPGAAPGDRRGRLARPCRGDGGLHPGPPHRSRDGLARRALHRRLGASGRDQGEIREPGDNFEVAWMLYGHARLTGDARARAAADGLYEFSLRHGVDFRARLPAGGLRPGDPAGPVLKDAKPLWAQTELVKAALGRLEVSGESGGGRPRPAPSGADLPPLPRRPPGTLAQRARPRRQRPPRHLAGARALPSAALLRRGPCASGRSSRHGMYDKFTSALTDLGALSSMASAPPAARGPMP